MNKKGMIPTLLGIACAIAVMAGAFAMMHREKPVERRKISVILNKSSDSRWTSLIAGLRDAAAENNVNLNIVTTDIMDSLEQEIGIAAREIQSGAEGIVIDLASDESIEEIVERFSPSVAIEIVDSGEYSGYGENNIGSIYIDDAKTGQALCDLLLEQEGISRIGIVSGHPSQSASSRLSSLVDACEENNISIKWISGDEEIEAAGLDAIVALENGALETTADALANVRRHVCLIGYGNSKKNIYYLDNGVIDAMIVPNEFQMGYLALTHVLERIENPNAPMANKTVDTVVVHREDIFTSKMETLLFPIAR